MTIRLKRKQIGTIYDAATEAIAIAKVEEEDVQFEFDGYRIVAHPQSYAGDIVMIYQLYETLAKLGHHQSA